MSRLAKRLKNFQSDLRGRNPQPQPDYTEEEYPQEYPEEEQYYEPEPGQYYEEADFGEEQEYPMEPNPLVKEYERLQKQASEYDKEIRAMESTNPHTLFKEIVNNPTPKGAHKMRLFGRPVDLSKLENYMIFKVSPKSITTLMRYNNSKSIEEIKGYSKRKPIKFKSGLIWIILGAAAIMIIGLVLLTQGPALTEMMKGMFGGM